MDFAKVILIYKLQEKFFQILTTDTILEFWESLIFEHLTLGILTLPPRSSRVEPRRYSLEPGESRLLEPRSSGWNQLVKIQGVLGPRPEGYSAKPSELDLFGILFF